MKRRPQPSDNPSISFKKTDTSELTQIGLVLSGGGSRAAYQVGALRALEPYLDKKHSPISVLVGSSIGAVNALILGAGLKQGLHASIQEIENLWVERTFRNSFAGSPSRAFLRSIKIAILQYMSPGPNPSSTAIFDPTPLMQRVDLAIQKFGGLTPDNRATQLKAVAVITTIEGAQRKPLLFVSSHKRYEAEILNGASFEICYVVNISATHGFASAALPSVLPPVELDTDAGKVRLVDGGISQNVPVDPAVRLGADKVVVIDISGRDWWHNRFDESHDKRPSWEVPAESKTYCMRPPETFVVRCQKPLGPLLKSVVGGSTRKFMAAAGVTWPLFTILKNKFGEEVAYEFMTYVALDPDYSRAVIERGFDETKKLLSNRRELEFRSNDSFQQAADA